MATDSMVEYTVLKVSSKLAGVTFPISMNLTTISFVILRSVSFPTDVFSFPMAS